MMEDLGHSVEIVGHTLLAGDPWDILTLGCLAFLTRLVEQFRDEADIVFGTQREERRLKIQTNGISSFEFLLETRSIREDPSWTVRPLPPSLRDRRVDIGDVDPSNARQFVDAIESKASGVQVDFDDAFCPTWDNVIMGHRNLKKAVAGELSPNAANTPLLVVRPRAWNMQEKHVFLEGRTMWGPLFDFGVHMYHNALNLYQQGRGPVLYLSKIEGHREAAVWDSIFEWTERELGLPRYSIKACVLIESLPAAFEMEEILWELRNRSAGLNTGLWDYCATFITRLGQLCDRIFPERSTVSMELPFLTTYRRLLVDTCKRRGAIATGGMFPGVAEDAQGHSELVQKAIAAKRGDADAGTDGALVYDPRVAEPIKALFWVDFDQNGCRQGRRSQVDEIEMAIALVDLPKASSTSLRGLYRNLEISLRYFDGWLNGVGHFVLNGSVEDSATAEISRSIVWQQIYHQVVVDEDRDFVEELRQVGLQHHTNVSNVTPSLVRSLLDVLKTRVRLLPLPSSSPSVASTTTAAELLYQVLILPTCVPFITTWLNDLPTEEINFALMRRGGGEVKAKM